MKKKYLQALTVFGIIMLLIGIITLIVIFWKYFSTTELIKNSNDIKQSTDLTSSIGSIISGTVGVMFSFCSIIFFILALIYQQSELKESRKILQIQSFESTFFNLLKFQQDIRERVFKSAKPTYLPYASVLNVRIEYWNFEDLYVEFKRVAEGDLKTFGVDHAVNNPENLSFNDFLITKYNFTEEQLKENPRSACYRGYFHTYHTILGNYHRNLYHALKYVYEAERNEENEKYNNGKAIIDLWTDGEKIIDEEIYKKYRKYADFVQAQMSTDEMALVFYNGFIFPKMKILINHYDLLENLPDDYLVNKSDANFYD